MSRYTADFYRDMIECDYCDKTIMLAEYGEDDDAPEDEGLPEGWIEWTRPPDPRGDWPETIIFYPGWREREYIFCCKAHREAFKEAHPPQVLSPTYAEYLARPQSHVQYTGMPEFW